MKAAAQPLSAATLVGKSRLAVWSELVKARLTLLVLLTTLAGFYLGAPEEVPLARMVHTLIGTGLLACGAAALNQLLERAQDAKMRRTQDRPLPSGRLAPETALVFGWAAALAGLSWLAAWVAGLAAAVGALTLAAYLFVYTPLKRRTWLNTLVGAVPGALPPVLGWSAARGELGQGGWTLFGILFFWQVAHFLAIAWLHREDYARAGFVMLPNLDPSGARTGRLAVAHAAGLLLASLTPAAAGLAGPWYLAGSVVLGAGFVGMAVRFARRLTPALARGLFLASIVYLPLLLGLMAVDKRPL